MSEPKDRKPSLSFDEDVGTLKRKTGQGAAVIMATQVINSLLHFAWTITMARILAPSDFGLVAMALPAYALATLISGMGIGQAVIQRKDLTHAELSNLYWCYLGVVFVTGLLTIASAPLISGFYDVAEVADLVVAYGLLLILSGTGGLHQLVLLRRLRFIHRGAISVCALVVGITAGLIYAQFWPSFWALFVMEAASTITGVILSWIFSGWVPGWYDRSVRVGGMLRFGINIAVARLMNFVTDNADTILIAKTWGQTALGFYDRAFKLVLAPTGRTTGAIASVAQTILSRLVHDPDRYRQSFLALNRLAILIVSPGILCAVLMADHLVPLLLGDGWGPVIPIFQAFGVLAVIRTMVVMFNWLFIAEGRGREFRQWGILRAVFVVTAMVIGVQWGPAGLAAAYAGVVVLVLTPIHMVWVTRGSAINLSDLIMTILIFAPGFVCSSVALFTMSQMLALHPAVLFVLGLVTSYALNWSIVLLFAGGREAIWKGIRLAKAGLDRPISSETLDESSSLKSS